MTSVGRAYSHYHQQLAREEARRKGLEWPPKEKYDILLDLFLVGDRGVGKAHFTGRFSRDGFGSRYPSFPTTLRIPDFESRKVFVDEKLVKIQLWDIHGREYLRYRNTYQWHRSKGFIIIFDITNQDSFESVQSWLEAIKEVNEDSVKFLVGNKVDLSKNQRKVPLDTALEFAYQHDMPYFETSCYDGTNVELAVMTMVARLMPEDTEPDASSSTRKTENFRSCCIT